MSELSILVVSCDKYADLWPIFIRLFKKKWQDCKWPVYIGSNYIQGNGFYKTICIGEDQSWCDNAAKMLEQIDSEYILMMLEDFFIDKRVDSSKVDECFQWMKDNDYSCLRLKPSPPPSEMINWKLGIGKLHPELPYYVSTQPAIWKKTILRDLLKHGYSAWDFEKKNSEDAGKGYGKFAGTNKAVIHHKNGVERGKFYSSVIKFLNKEGVDISEINRDVLEDETFFEVFQIYQYKLKDWIRAKILYRWRVNLKKK